MTETGSYLMVFRSRNKLRYEPLLTHREKAVAVYPHHNAPAPDGGKGSPDASAPAPEIMAVHRTGEIIIGIGIEPV